MSKSLSFTRVTRLMEAGNWDEGKLSLKTKNELRKIFAKRIEEIRKKGTDISMLTGDGSDPLRLDDLVYVNSWTKDNKESKSMWKRYAPNGVIIKSTVDKLEAVTRNNSFLVYCNDVTYNDYSVMDSPQPPFIKYMIKDIQSINDNEFRALIVAEKQGDRIDISVNLNDLITDVIVHRNNDLKTVQKLLDNNNVDAKATMSQLTGS